MSEEVVQLGAEPLFQGLMRLESGWEEGIWAPSWSLWEAPFHSAALNQLPMGRGCWVPLGPKANFLYNPNSKLLNLTELPSDFIPESDRRLTDANNQSSESRTLRRSWSQAVGDWWQKPQATLVGCRASSIWCHNGRLAKPTNWTTKSAPPSRARFQPCCPWRQSSVKTIYKSWCSRRALKTLLCQNTKHWMKAPFLFLWTHTHIHTHTKAGEERQISFICVLEGSGSWVINPKTFHTSTDPLGPFRSQLC